MTTFQIKILAIIFMIVDHVGYIFFPHILFFRIIGRLSFPLFSWLIANGARYTHNGKSYFLRILAVAIISQIPYVLVTRLIYPDFWDLNALFALALGLLAIEVMKKTNSSFLQFFVTFVCAFAAILFNIDYGAVGVVSVVFFYYYSQNFKNMFFYQFV